MSIETENKDPVNYIQDIMREINILANNGLYSALYDAIYSKHSSLKVALEKYLSKENKWNSH